MSFQTNPDPSVLAFSLYTKRAGSADDSNYWAATAAEIIPSRFEVGSKDGRKYVTSVSVEVRFNARDSWVLQSKASDSKLLEHERLHYMLVCAFGRRFHDEILKLSKPSTGQLQRALESLRGDCRRLSKRYEASYDSETDHGRKPDRQATWSSRIRDWYHQGSVPWS